MHDLKTGFGGKDLTGAIDPELRTEQESCLQTSHQCSAKEGKAKWQIFYEGLM